MGGGRETISARLNSIPRLTFRPTYVCNAGVCDEDILIANRSFNGLELWRVAAKNPKTALKDCITMVLSMADEDKFRFGI